MADLTLVQKGALIGCAKYPRGMFKPRKVVTAALVRRGYVIELHTGAIELTEAGREFIRTGKQL